MHVSLETKELKKIIKEAIKELLEEERIENFLRAIPSVSQKEMNNIKKIHKKPSKKTESVYEEKLEI